MRHATIDIDSFPIEVHGKQHGASYNGHYRQTVYHPLVASFCVGGDYDSTRNGDRLRDCGYEGLVIEQAQDAKPMIHLSQRHFEGQRSRAQVDAALEADLRTAVPGKDHGVKYQPQWFEAIYNVLINKKSNMQMGIEVRFSYTCPRVRTEKAVDLFAHAWIAISPLLEFVLNRD